MRSPTLASVCEAGATGEHAWQAKPWRIDVDGVTWVGATDGVHALLERRFTEPTDAHFPPTDCRALVLSWFTLREQAPTATADVDRADELRSQLGSRRDAQLELGWNRGVRLRATGLRSKPMLPITGGTLSPGVVSWERPSEGQSVYLSLLARAMGWVCSRSIPLVELRQASPLTAILVSTAPMASARFAIVMPARW